MLINLCTNAWHSMGEHGGTIEVSLDSVMLAGEAGLAPGRYARLRVEDTGSGMDEATRKRIFEPFFTTKPAGIGTGLGLSVVHGIVQAHEGAIRLTSSPGAGSRFDIFLPAMAQVDAAAALTLVDMGGKSAGRGERVLYLDDDEVMGLMVERLLARANFAVTCLRDSDEALTLFTRDPLRFDILVMDYNMPRHSGLEVVRQVLRLRPGFPTVISSGYVSGELLALSKAPGVAEVLEKQNALEELSAAIVRALARSESAQAAGQPPAH